MVREFWLRSPMGVRADELFESIIDLIRNWIMKNMKRHTNWELVFSGIFGNQGTESCSKRENCVSMISIYGAALHNFSDYSPTSTTEISTEADLLSTIEARHDYSSWVRPPKGKIKVNVDAAFKNPPFAAAAIARDYSGKFLDCITLTGVGGSTEEAELSAMILGLNFAKKYNSPCRIEGDSLKVVTWINDNFFGPVGITIGNSGGTTSKP